MHYTDTKAVSIRQTIPRVIPYALPILAVIGLVIFIYRGTFTWWWYEWTYPGSFYAHALFVPFFVGAMIWRDRERLAAAPYDPSWLGLAYIVPSILLLLLGRKSNVTTVESMSFMLLVLGACTMVIGKTRTRLLLFPLLFIMLMMPLVPDQLINSIAFPIQMTSAKIATFLLNMLTLHSTRTGTLIQMDSYKLAVEFPCSGFKTLVSLLTFTAAFAYLTDAAPWKRWALFLTTIPLSLFINALRITLIGIVGELISSKAATTFHDYSGFIVLILAFTFLFNFARILRCERFLGIPLDDEPADARDDGEARKPAEDSQSPQVQREPWWTPLAAWRPNERHLKTGFPFALALTGVLLVTATVSTVAFQRTVPELPIARSQVPMEFTSPGRQPGSVITYKAIDDPNNDRLSKEVQETLKPSRVISRVYQGTDGSTIELFMTAGNGRKVFHDPHTCMLGSDAILKDIGPVDVPSSFGTLRMLETRFKNALLPDETEMLICYVVDGQMVPRTEDVRNHIIFQTVFGDGGKPSYWVRITQKSTGADSEKRDQLVRFAGGLWGRIGPILEGQIKGAPDAKPEPIVDPNASTQ